MMLRKSAVTDSFLKAVPERQCSHNVELPVCMLSQQPDSMTVLLTVDDDLTEMPCNGQT